MGEKPETEQGANNTYIPRPPDSHATRRLRKMWWNWSRLEKNGKDLPARPSPELILAEVHGHVWGMDLAAGSTFWPNHRANLNTSVVTAQQTWMTMIFSKAGFQKQNYFFTKTSQESWLPLRRCFKRLDLKIFSASARGTKLYGSFVFTHIWLRKMVALLKTCE